MVVYLSSLALSHRRSYFTIDFHHFNVNGLFRVLAIWAMSTDTIAIGHGNGAVPPSGSSGYQGFGFAPSNIKASIFDR
jgi:hypothetical protein